MAKSLNVDISKRIRITGSFVQAFRLRIHINLCNILRSTLSIDSLLIFIFYSVFEIHLLNEMGKKASRK